MHSPLQDGANRIEFGLTQLPVEYGFEYVQRQFERVQDEIGRFVTGVMRAMTESEALALELRDRFAQYCAQRYRSIGFRFQTEGSRRSSTCR